MFVQQVSNMEYTPAMRRHRRHFVFCNILPHTPDYFINSSVSLRISGATRALSFCTTRMYTG